MHVVQVHSNTQTGELKCQTLRFKKTDFLNFSLLGSLSVPHFLSKPLHRHRRMFLSSLRLQIIRFELTLTKTPGYESERSGRKTRCRRKKGNRYAKAEITQLHAKLCDMYNVPKNFLLLTDGSSEGIRALLCVFAFAESSAGNPGTYLWRWTALRRAL